MSQREVAIQPEADPWAVVIEVPVAVGVQGSGVAEGAPA